MLRGGLLAAPPPGIEGLSAGERDRLETTLVHRFMTGSHNMPATTADGAVANLPPVPPEALQAMQAWLMVQSARLRHVAPGLVEQATRDLMLHHIAATEDAQIQINRAQVQQEARAALGSAHAARIRPEYADALNNFLRLLEPDRLLHPVLRSQVMVTFSDHMRERRISPQVVAVVEAQGLEAIARQGYRLNGYSGNFQSRDERRGLTPAVTPERAMAPQPSGEGSSAATRQPAPMQPPALNLTAEEQRWLNQTLDLSSTPRERTGKLPDSRQYRHIKSLPPEGRAALEATLEALFMQPADRTTPQTTQRALEAWLTAQQVRLRVHSEASLKHHAKALRSVGHAAQVVKATLGANRGRSEFSRFHSEHESANRPEYAMALNNFLRVLHPSSPLSDELKQRVAERLSYHAETEGTISAPVLAELRRHGPLILAADEWNLDPVNNVFARPAAAVIGPGDRPTHWARPVRHTPPHPSQPSPRTGAGQTG